MIKKIILRGDTQKDYAIAEIGKMQPDPERLVEVIFQEHKTSRSLEQNRLYWEWMTVIGDDMGFTKDGMHEFMMRQHLQPILTETPDGIVETYTTKGLGVKAMTIYLGKIDIMAGMQNIRLPHPDDLGR